MSSKVIPSDDDCHARSPKRNRIGQEVIDECDETASSSSKSSSSKSDKQSDIGTDMPSDESVRQVSIFSVKPINPTFLEGEPITSTLSRAGSAGSSASNLDMIEPETSVETANTEVIVENVAEKEGSENYAQAADEADALGPYQVQHRVFSVVEKWGSITPIPPEKFLQKLLMSRNYSARFVCAIDVRNRCHWQPTMKQMVDYDREMVDAVRNSNLPKLKALASSGRNLSACNKFSESIMHMACRRSDFDTVKFLIDNGANIMIVDDYGRTPLHDACWRTEPRFDIVTLLLDKNLEILRMTDVRGSCPLNYVRQEHWVHWCAYFFHQKEKYWAKLDEPEVSKI
jgi:hypothetical protein